MRRVILLLPDPDVLQLANCHKYVTRGFGRSYEEVYTTSTIKGNCANVDKILVIGHGQKGAFETATIDDIANAIFDSSISLTDNKKVAFDTCYAGYSDRTAVMKSALYQVGQKLKGKNKACNLVLVGATGPTVTIGSFGYSVSIPFVGRIDLSAFGGRQAFGRPGFEGRHECTSPAGQVDEAIQSGPFLQTSGLDRRCHVATD